MAAVAMVAAASVSASAFNVGNIVVKRGIVREIYLQQMPKYFIPPGYSTE